MRNIRAIACVLIILGAVLVEVSFQMINARSASIGPDTVKSLLPALVGLILINRGAKALLTPPR